MKIQLVFLILFALNLLLIWLKIPWYRSLGRAVLNLLPFFTVFFDQPRFQLDFFYWKIAGVILIILGLAIIVWVSKTPRKNLDQGPYRYVRHPWYLALIFVWVGWWWVWAAIYSFYLGMFMLALVWLQAYLEEKKFGEEYKEYKRTTGMFWIK